MTIPWPLEYEEVLGAADRLRSFLPPTPLCNHPVLDEELGLRVLVKHENQNRTGSFKVRNGLAVLTAMDSRELACGVIAASRGNHGQGVAYAARLLGTKATICVPVGNNTEKNAAMRAYGAEVIEEGRDYDDSVGVMLEIAAREGQTVVHSTNDPRVLAGAGTLTLELVSQAEAAGERVDALLVAVGGGSQAVGAMTVLRERWPEVPVIAVQAERAAAIHDSWHARLPVRRDSADTIADGLATRQTYALTFPALCEGLEDFVTVTEAELAASVRQMLRTTHSLVEPAGAAPLAALRKLRARFRGKTVALVASGANISQSVLRAILNEKL